MPSNDDIKQHGEEVTKDGAYSDTPVASVMLDDNAASADETSTYNLGADEVSSAHSSLNHSMPQEFTFFSKKEISRSSGFGSICGLRQYRAGNSPL